MELKYLGKNKRDLHEWLVVELDVIIENWQKEQLIKLVNQLEEKLHRQLDTKELHVIAWLSNYEQSTLDVFADLFDELNTHKKHNVNQKKGEWI